jgi:hypothetical protein
LLFVPSAAAAAAIYFLLRTVDASAGLLQQQPQCCCGKYSSFDEADIFSWSKPIENKIRLDL